MAAVKTLHEATELLCAGYIRDECIESEDTYPLELDQVVSAFLGQILLRFDRVNDAHNGDDNPHFRHRYISVDGKEIKAYSYNAIIVGCSLGVNKGSTEFKIECINAKDDAVGILTDIDSCIHVSPLNISHLMKTDVKGNKYFWYGTKGIFNGDDVHSCSASKWNNGDVITVRVDCVAWKVTFLCGDKDSGTLDISPNLIYYLFLCTEWGTSHYRLVD